MVKANASFFCKLTLFPFERSVFRFFSYEVYPRNVVQLRIIAQPLAQSMKRRRPSLARVFDDRLTLTNSRIMIVVSFIGSMLLHSLIISIYHKWKKEKIKLISPLTPPLASAQETILDSAEPSAPFQETLNEHANRTKLEITVELNNVRAHAFTAKASYINRDVSKSQPGRHSMNENIVPLTEH